MGIDELDRAFISLLVFGVGAILMGGMVNNHAAVYGGFVVLLGVAVAACVDLF